MNPLLYIETSEERESSLRRVLDYRVARVIYRFAKAQIRAAGDFCWRVMFEDFEDRDWLAGVLLAAAATALFLLVLRPWQ